MQECRGGARGCVVMPTGTSRRPQTVRSGGKSRAAFDAVLCQQPWPLNCLQSFRRATELYACPPRATIRIHVGGKLRRDTQAELMARSQVWKCLTAAIPANGTVGTRGKPPLGESRRDDSTLRKTSRCRNAAVTRLCRPACLSSDRRFWPAAFRPACLRLAVPVWGPTRRSSASPARARWLRREWQSWPRGRPARC